MNTIDFLSGRYLNFYSIGNTKENAVFLLGEKKEERGIVLGFWEIESGRWELGLKGLNLKL